MPPASTSRRIAAALLAATLLPAGVPAGAEADAPKPLAPRRIMQDKKASLAPEQAAAAGDGRRVIGAFADLQASCLACHESFRPPFVEHFHGPER